MFKRVSYLMLLISFTMDIEHLHTYVSSNKYRIIWLKRLKKILDTFQINSQGTYSGSQRLFLSLAHSWWPISSWNRLKTYISELLNTGENGSMIKKILVLPSKSIFIYAVLPIRYSAYFFLSSFCKRNNYEICWKRTF